MRRFLETLDRFGDESVVLGYHGTPGRNLPSIFARGLLIPGRYNNIPIANGCAHGLGIYLAEAGNHQLSKSYLKGSENMLICAVIDSTIVPPKDDSPQAVPGQPSVASKATKPKLVFRGGVLAHRSHRRPHVAAPPVPQVVPPKRREDAVLSHVGGALVVFRESHVAPLFVAGHLGDTEDLMEEIDFIAHLLEDDTEDEEPEETSVSSRRCDLLTPLDNRSQAPLCLSQKQIWDEALGEVLWRPPAAETGGHARALKRRLTRRLQDVQRRGARISKWSGP
mmetsp:Transcript_18392/g.40219  ORF Transcript_18392/g.40219 Transcript_18392/m.40219 type:complete len:280 (+) Transcript_18392:1-840(+)